MKSTLTLLFALLLTASGFAQKEPRFTLFLNSDTLCQSPLPFAALKIIDARFDQDIVGCTAKSLSFKGATKHKTIAVLPDSLKTYLPALLQQGACFDKTKSDTLVMLVKQLWIADHIRSTLDKYSEAESVLSISCSFFQIDGNQLIKLFSVDEITAEAWEPENGEDDLRISKQRSIAVSRLFRNILANRNWQPSTVKFSIADVTEGVQKRLQLPLYSDAQPVAGVYKTFAEFKNNSPSITEVRIGRRFDGAIFELLDPNGNQIDINTIWGLCDGKQRFVTFQSGLHPLNTIGKNFRFVFSRRQAGDKAAHGSPNIALVGGLFYPGNSAVRGYQNDFQDEYLYLNLETGAVHVEEIIGTAPIRKLRTKSR